MLSMQIRIYSHDHFVLGQIYRNSIMDWENEDDDIFFFLGGYLWLHRIVYVICIVV